MKIYLAGGFHSGWQEHIISKLSLRHSNKHTFYNPKTDADQRFPYRYTQQEIDAMKTCGLVFAYFEVENPSGLGLAKEIGWATILDIPVWYVDEHDRLNSFLCACSQRVYSSFNKAVEDLYAI